MKDAQKALSVDPSYHKGYSRLGHAHFCLKDYEASVEAYKKAVEADPGNANLKASLLSAEEKAGVLVRGGEDEVSTGMPNGMPDLSALGGLGGGLGGMDFGAIMNNPGFMQMASQMMSNPAFSSMLQNPEMAQMCVSYYIQKARTNSSHTIIMNRAQKVMQDPSALKDLMANPDVAKMAGSMLGKNGGPGGL